MVIYLSFDTMPWLRVRRVPIYLPNMYSDVQGGGVATPPLPPSCVGLPTTRFWIVSIMVLEAALTASCMAFCSHRERIMVGGLGQASSP